MKKLLVFDMDGTLYTSNKIISKKTKETIMKAQQDGMRVVCATGRTCNIMEEVFEELDLYTYKGFCVGNNGQQLLNLETNEYTVGDKIPQEVVEICCKVAAEDDREMYGVDNNISHFRTTIHASKHSYERQAALYDYEKEQFVDMHDYDKVGYFIPEDRNDANELEAKLMALIQDKAQVLKTNDICVEISPNNVDKCYGLDRLCERYGYSIDDVLVFGDGLNDIKMMQKYPSCAMGNAYDEVKAVANYVVASNDEDGIAEGIEKYAY
jgi:Cof subfamily protein (haloacid dehalogenase superfamily)